MSSAIVEVSLADQKKLVEVSSSSKFIWRIEKFSKLNSEDGLISDVFSVGSFKWKVIIYPKGEGEVYDHLSVFLIPVKLTKAMDTEFRIVVTSQTNSKNGFENDGKVSFTGGENGRGWPKFMRLDELRDPAKGYVVNDTCIVTVEVSWRTNEDTIVDTKAVVKFESQPEKVAEVKTENQLGEHPGAGQPFGDGRLNKKVDFSDDKEFEDIGGFSILRRQAPVYMQIWLKYGHIPSPQSMPISSYPILVMVVKELMICIIEMHQCRYVDLSCEMIQGWEELLKMADRFEFNIGWLQERFENVKKGVGGMQKLKTELLEHGKPFRAAKSKIKTIEDELKKTEAQMIAAKDYLRDNTSGLLPESDMEMYLEIGEDLLLEGLF
ncbi:hypothetical protein MKX03_000644 [Papaver bracteatum]|nr:hypothetical protein MKX03_000644 [Papaver bracteatum]